MIQTIEKPEKGMMNAGLIFVFTVWLQGQMADLVILKKNPALIPDFVSEPTKVPPEFHKLRVTYWEKQFGDVKTQFIEAFSDQLTEQELSDIEQIFHVRNMIGHAHISIGRDYMLYRPGHERKEQEVLAAFKPESVIDPADPVVIKLSFWKQEVFQAFSDQIGRLDQVCFARLARSLGVPHGRIR